MTETKRRVAWLAPWALALATVLAAGASAGASGTAAVGAEDMRLWSFGECDRRFPYTNSDEHKECVRVVGSAEAKDARALRMCALSHAHDPAEIERCQSGYQANKEKAAQDGVVPNTTAAPQAPPSAEVMRNVKAITAAAVEANRADAGPVAAPAPAVEEAPPAQEDESSIISTIGTVFLVLVLLGLVATLARRRMAASA